MHSVISTTNAPTPGDYSQGRVVDFGDFIIIYTSGQTANDPHTPGEPVLDSDVFSQTRYAAKNARAILDAGSDGKATAFVGNLFLQKSARLSPGFSSYNLARMLFDTLKVDAPDATTPCRLFGVDGIPLHNEPTTAEVNAIGVVGTIPPEYIPLVNLATRITPPLSSSYREFADGIIGGYRVRLHTGITILNEYPRDEELVLREADAYGQTKVALQALCVPLEEIVAMNVVLKDMKNDWDGFSTAYRETFTNTDLLPVRTTVEDQSMGPRVRMSVLAIGKQFAIRKQ